MTIYRCLLAVALCALPTRELRANIIFSQDFSAFPNGGLDKYYSSSPDATKWTSISSYGSYASANVTGGALNFTRGGDGTAWFSRRANFVPAPSAVIYQFDLSVSGNSTQPNYNPAATWQIGDAFDDTRSLQASSVVHSQFSLLFTSSPGVYQLRTPGGSTSVDLSGKKTVTWVINNSGASLSYLGPNNLAQTVANDTWDLWVGSSRVFNDVMANGQVGALTDIKFALNNGFGTVTMDNFRIDDQVQLVPEPALTGALAASFAIAIAVFRRRPRQRESAGGKPVQVQAPHLRTL